MGLITDCISSSRSRGRLTYTLYFLLWMPVNWQESEWLSKNIHMYINLTDTDTTHIVPRDTDVWSSILNKKGNTEFLVRDILHKTVEIPNLKNKSNSEPNPTRKQSLTRLLSFTKQGTQQQSHLFPLCKTCQRQIRVLNKVPLVTYHRRKQMFRLPLQKETSDSGRWWNGADPKLFWRSSEPVKPAAAWSVLLTLPPGERKRGEDQRKWWKQGCGVLMLDDTI